MIQNEYTVSDLLRNKYFLLVIALLAAATLAGLAGVLGAVISLPGVILILLTVLLAIALRWPNTTVIFVAFIIYTNTAVVMIKFHGVPEALGYALPLLLVVPFIWQVFINKKKLKLNFVFALMLVYFSILVLGSAFSNDIMLAIPNVINFIAEGLGLYFLLINTIRTPNVLKQVVWSLLIGGAIIGALSLYQQITGTHDNNYWGFAQVTGQGFATIETLQGEVIQARVSGPIGEKNRYAQIMLMLVPIGLFQAWGERSRALRLLAFILTGFIFVGGSLAFSRGAQIGFLLLVIIMTFMRYIRVQQLLTIFLGIVLLLIAFPQNNVRFGTLANVFASPEEGGLRSADGSIQGRATEMLAAMLVFIDHPIIGVGPGMFRYEMEEYAKIVNIRNITTVREAHSLYPGVAAETGALGFITLMTIFGYTLYRLAKARKYWLERNNIEMASLNTGFFLAIISYMTTGIFLHMSYIRYLWLIFALAAVASQFRESHLSNSSDNRIQEAPSQP